MLRYLPVIHPEFLYPEESRNPYLKKLGGAMSEGLRAIQDQTTETFQSKWRSQFAFQADGQSKESLLHVEIGTNGGHVLNALAQKFPKELFIGLDWKRKQIYKAAEKAKKRGILNTFYIRAFAERLPYIFGPAEIDRLYLYFPDPWAKKSQLKHRYITSENLIRFAPLVKRGGLFHIKTDHDGYFDWILEAVQGASEHWKVRELSRDLHAGNPEAGKLNFPDVTLFEKLFIQKGIPIKSVWLERL